MESTTRPFSTYIRYLQAIGFTALLLYAGKTLFVPLFFGLLIAIILYPVCKWLENHGWKKPIAISACLLIVTIVFASILWLLIWQINIFLTDVPQILSKIDKTVQLLQQWMNTHLGVATNIHNTWNSNFTGSLGTMLQATVETSISTLFTAFLIPVYSALFLYHRKVLVRYLQLITPFESQIKLATILQQTIHTYYNFIKGMVLVYLIVGVLNSIGLYALGVQNAILFGMLCAVMTIIPYIGIFVSALLPISVIWMQTGNIWYPLGVIAIFSFVQYLEANVIFPKVVGTQLQVSTLAMLIAVIVGGIIWGMAGMVLFIPFVAILKIISDHIEQWKPINLLLARK